MIKLFKTLLFRIFFKMAVTVGGIWFYFILQEPSLLNKVLFSVFYLSLFIGLAIDIKVALNRFLSTPAK
jgi:hypothetical protein